MVKKKNLTKAFFVSLIIGVLIFSLGLFVGYGLDVLRIKDVSTSLSEVELQTLDYITSQEFLEFFGGDNCDLLNSRLSSMSPQLFDMGQRLVRYEERDIFSGKDYELLKSKYFLLQVRAYVLFNNLKDECGIDSDLVLYFYDQDHEDSKRQGYVLDKLVDIDNANVFSFDRSFEIIIFLIDRYEIEEAPTVIINEEKRFEGLTFLGELRKAVQ
tara:strand:+ start:1215 stop:1853 length:639 start_codon:yes stop_codon:yes gene_type:complete